MHKLLQWMLFRRQNAQLRKAIVNGMTKLTTPPQILSVQFNGKGCNMTCNMCGQHYMPENWSEVDRFQSVLIPSLAKHMNRIQYFNATGGDPLNTEQMGYVVDAMGAAPLTEFRCYTNGLALEEWADRINRIKRVRVSVSLDAADESTYRTIRGSTRFRQVLAGIKALRKDIPVSFNFIVFRENAHQIEDVIRLCRDLGVGSINFQSPTTGPTRLAPGTLENISVVEWVARSSPWDDMELCADILRRLHRAEQQAVRWGVRYVTSRVPKVIYEYHPYLKGIESVPEDALRDHLKELADTHAVYTGFKAPSFESEDFGADPKILTFNVGGAIHGPSLTVVSLAPKARSKAVRSYPVNMDEGVWPVDPGLPAGEYEVFLSGMSDPGYSVPSTSVRSRFTLTEAGRPSGFRHTPIRTPVVAFNESKRVFAGAPDRLPGFKPKPGFFCYMHFVKISIQPSGTQSCCFEQEEYNNLPFDSMDLMSIWNSDGMKEIRMHMLEGRGQAKVCRKLCPYYSDGLWEKRIGLNPFS